MSELAPLILTLELDAESFAYFDALRRAHFPPERNVLAAHLTLFHNLPGDELDSIQTALTQYARNAALLPMTAIGIRFLGRGVAFEIESAALRDLRAGLAERWMARLSNQDRQTFRPHVTVQNKVAPDAARALQHELSVGFAPFPVVGTGLALWRYLGGPWRLVKREPFVGSAR